ncbi:MAG: sugar transferase [Phycisphaeraceae bacterium]|nr:sugar transferase [Phycisphaeraceae bacterium]
MVGLAGTGREHTVWGLDAVALQARFWASRGVQVVRLGEPSQIVDHAELFLLTSQSTLAFFDLPALLEWLSWTEPDLTFLRLHDTSDQGYREVLATGKDGRFAGFRRVYRGGPREVARVAVTTDARLAQLWQGSPDPLSGWKLLRRMVRRGNRAATSVDARVYDSREPEDVARYIRDLVQVWRRPDATIPRVRRIASGVWADEGVSVPSGVSMSGPLWIGAGRTLEPGASAVGPAVMWDRPEARPPIDEIKWLELEALNPPDQPRPKYKGRPARAVKRVFDLAFASLALLASLPLYPLIALAIYLEDGRPIFFGHLRESVGGREFKCLKFRSMRRDAEHIKAMLKEKNQADGPQFYMENDPRLTRVGRFLRKTQLDEIPQFINVLKGDMAIVGPRPSPFDENQFCPAWREARLSVRPGVTGLWQIRRTRAAGSDFQEWIKYDIEYVEKQSLALDLWIIWRTIVLVFRGVARQ